MKTLIVDDDFTSRVLLSEILGGYGATHVAVNGKEAITAVTNAMKEGSAYDLVCLDIEMPEMSGQDVLKEIRRMEEAVGIMLGNGVKIIMTTAHGDVRNVMGAFRETCDAYLVKPFNKAKLIEQIRMFGLM